MACRSAHVCARCGRLGADAERARLPAAPNRAMARTRERGRSEGDPLAPVGRCGRGRTEIWTTNYGAVNANNR